MATNFPIPSFTELVQLGFKNQLLQTGPFSIGIAAEQTTINNELLAEVGLRYVSSHRNDFDNGIHSTISVIGNAGKCLLDAVGTNDFVITFYNPDCEGNPLDVVWIEDKRECESIYPDHRDLSKWNASKVADVEQILSDQLQSKEVQHINLLALTKF